MKLCQQLTMKLQWLFIRLKALGTTQRLLTRIPHYREVLLVAFECPHCNERNNEIQFAGELQPRGCSYYPNVPNDDLKALDRCVVKWDSASIKIPELDFEIHPEAQRGTLSTVEGILVRGADELQALQDGRKKVDPKTAEALGKFLVRLKSFAVGEACFTFILDYPAGNSFIENRFALAIDPLLTIKYYFRTPEQQATLGFLVDSESARQYGADDGRDASLVTRDSPSGGL